MPYSQETAIGKPVRQSTIVALGCFAMLVMTACEPTSSGLVVESVNNYSLRNGPSLNNSVANGDGFIQGMTVAGSPWHLTTRWTDLNVWDTDFIDPAIDRAGDNSHNFDQPGTALFYFT